MSNTTVAEVYGITPPRGYAPAFLEKSPQMVDRMVGIEVEVEGIADNRIEPPRGWDVKGDGSLRNGGVEFITAPTSAQRVGTLVESLMEYLETPAANFTMRTSIHVHVDATRLTQDQVLLATALYTVVEPFLYRFVGRARENNIYCVPLYKTLLLSSFCYTNRSFPKGRFYWEKYTGYNLKTLARFGTIEFRHLSGTRNVTKIMTWIDIVTRIVEYASTRSWDEFKKLVLSKDRDINYGQTLAMDFLGSDLYSRLKITPEGLIPGYLLMMTMFAPSSTKTTWSNEAAEKFYLNYKGIL